MKSIRLNSYLKQCILDSVLKQFVSNDLKGTGCEDLESLRAKTEDLGRAVCLTLWQEAHGSHNFSAVPPWGLNLQHRFSVAGEGSGKLFEIDLKGNKPCRAGADLVITEERWESIFKESNVLVEKANKCSAERLSLRREVKPILDSFNTTKQLLETWPDMEKFLPANIADPSKGVNLPALSLSRLNEKINGSKT